MSRHRYHFIVPVAEGSFVSAHTPEESAAFPTQEGMKHECAVTRLLIDILCSMQHVEQGCVQSLASSCMSVSWQLIAMTCLLLQHTQLRHLHLTATLTCCTGSFMQTALGILQESMDERAVLSSCQVWTTVPAQECIAGSAVRCHAFMYFALLPNLTHWHLWCHASCICTGELPYQ